MVCMENRQEISHVLETLVAGRNRQKVAGPEMTLSLTDILRGRGPLRTRCSYSYDFLNDIYSIIDVLRRCTIHRFRDAAITLFG
jgi:hypothetical protein